MDVAEYESTRKKYRFQGEIRVNVTINIEFL